MKEEATKHEIWMEHLPTAIKVWAVLGISAATVLAAAALPSLLRDARTWRRRARFLGLAAILVLALGCVLGPANWVLVYREFKDK